MSCHRAVIDLQDRDRDHHENGEQRVIVVRNRLDEEDKAVRSFR